MNRIKALVFDVFGTVVDWHGSIVREGARLSAETGIAVDWPAFAEAWRAGYKPALDATRGPGAEWVDLDALNLAILQRLLPRFGLQGLSPEQVAHLNRVWHRLEPWPDAVGGLQRLRARRVVAPLSNGHVALLVAMARRAGLPWDCVLSAELARAYKPDPAVYLTAARLLRVLPAELMLVAAHPSDLLGAQRAGLATAYVPRPLEHGVGGPMAPVGDAVFDRVATDFHALADQFDADD